MNNIGGKIEKMQILVTAVMWQIYSSAQTFSQSLTMLQMFPLRYFYFLFIFFFLKQRKWWNIYSLSEFCRGAKSFALRWKTFHTIYRPYEWIYTFTECLPRTLSTTSEWSLSNKHSLSTRGCSSNEQSSPTVLLTNGQSTTPRVFLNNGQSTFTRKPPPNG